MEVPALIVADAGAIVTDEESWVFELSFAF